MRNSKQVELPSVTPSGETIGRVIEIREERVVRSITIREDDDCDVVDDDAVVPVPRGPAKPIGRLGLVRRAVGADLAPSGHGNGDDRGMPRPRPGDEEVAP